MNEKEVRFIAHLWRQDRKGFAELRRSLGEPPGTSVAAIPYVERFTFNDAPEKSGQRWRNDWNRQMHYLVAGLFCLVERPLEPHVAPPEAHRKNLGDSMAKLYLIKERSSSTEQRFIRLLDADAEQLADRLRQTVTLLCSESVPIGWELLLTNLKGWLSESRRVQHDWARSFYQRTEANEIETTLTGEDV